MQVVLLSNIVMGRREGREPEFWVFFFVGGPWKCGSEMVNSPELRVEEFRPRYTVAYHHFMFERQASKVVPETHRSMSTPKILGVFNVHYNIKRK